MNPQQHRYGGYVALPPITRIPNPMHMERCVQAIRLRWEREAEQKEKAL